LDEFKLFTKLVKIYLSFTLLFAKLFCKRLSVNRFLHTTFRVSIVKFDAKKICVSNFLKSPNGGINSGALVEAIEPKHDKI